MSRNNSSSPKPDASDTRKKIPAPEGGYLKKNVTKLQLGEGKGVWQIS